MDAAGAAPGAPAQGPGPLNAQIRGAEFLGGQSSHYAPGAHGPVIPSGEAGGLGDFGGGWPRVPPGRGDDGLQPYGFGPFGGGGGGP
eukprot:3944950-Alexandrium_andersonii.AAC.1